MQLRKFLAAAILLVASLGASNAHALVVSSAGANGNWNAVATWAIVTAGIPGTITTSTLSPTVTGVTTAFLQLAPGDQIYTNASVLIGTILTITNNTSLTLTANALVGVAGATYRIRKVPNTNDTVIIVNAAHTVQVTAAAATTTVTFTTGGTITTLQINAGQQLTVTGLTINSNTAAITKRVDLIAGATTLTVNGNVVLNRTVVGAIAEIRLGNNAGTLVDVSGNFTMNNAGENLTFSGAGTAKIGGALTAAGTLTVGTGTVEFDGAAVQAIPVYTYNNLTVSNTTSPASATVAATITVNGNLTVNANAVLQPAAATLIGGAGTLTGNGTVRVTRTAATPGFVNQYTITNKTLTNLTVEYFAAVAQTMSAITYGNVIINHSAGITTLAAGTSTVDGTLTLTAGTLAVAARTLRLNGPTIAGTPANLSTINTSTLYFGGSSAGVNVPSSVAQLSGLTVDNANGITLNSGPTINGTLTFTQGNISAGANTVIIPAAGTVSRTSGHVIGNLQKNFTNLVLTRSYEIGDANAYAPLAITFASVSVNGNLIAKTVSGEHPDIANSVIESAENVNRYWTATNSGITFTTYGATFNYAQGGYSADVDGGVTPGTFVVGRATPSSCGLGACTWTYPAISGTPTGTQAVITGVTSFSDFAIGHRRIANFLVEAAGGGGIPSQTQNVGFNIKITARDALGNTVTSFTGTVDITSGCTLSAGSGTTAAFIGGVLASHAVTISSIGSCSITATRTSGGSQTGTSNTFTVATEATAFNGCENTSPRCTVGGANYDRLFTKLSSTAFNLDLVALKSGGTLAAGFASTVTVDLLANSTPQAPGGNNCPASQTAVIPLGSSTFASGIPTAAIAVAGGAFSGVSPFYSAYRDVRVRVTCDATNCPPSGLTYCSADNFSVRPQSFTISAPVLTNTAQTGTPSAAAGSDFTLTATAVAGYDGTSSLDRTLAGQKVATHSGDTNYTERLRDSAGGASIAFPAATIGTGAAAKTVQYHDAGNFKVLAGGIVDSGFAVDDPSKGECVLGSSSNSDNDANANNGLVYGCNVGSQSNSSLFGRFYPDYYTMSAGTVTAACVAGGYSYMGHAAIGLGYTISAKSQDNPGGATLTLSKYTSGYGTLAPVSVLSEDGTTATDLTGNLTPSLTYSSIIWSAGDYAVSGSTYSFARTTPAGPYDSFWIGAGVTDADGALLNGRDFKLGDPACSGVTCTHKLLSASATKIRFGRLRLLNAVGAETLNLPLTLRAEYWNGSGFLTNTLDGCTVLTPDPAKKFVLYGHQGGITTGNMVTPTAVTDGNVSATGTFVSGATSLVLLKPSPAAASPGSVRICLDLDSGVPTDPSCAAVSPADLTHLQGNWTGGATYDKDPSARSAFGLFGAQPRQFIFFREGY